MLSKITGWLNPVNKIIDVIDKSVLDKDKAEEMKLDLMKLELEKYKEEKTVIQKLLDFVFPSLVLPLAVGFLINAIRGAFGYPTLYVPDELNYRLVETLMYLVLGKKAVDKAGKVYEKTHTK